MNYKLSHQYRNLFMDKTVPALQLTTTEAYIWLTIHRHTDWATGKASLSQARLQRLTGLSKSQVIRCLKRLRELHLLRRYAVGNTAGKHSVYAVCPDENTAHPALTKKRTAPCTP
jgi:hypothetical protein